MGREGWSRQSPVTICVRAGVLCSNILPESKSAASGSAPRRTDFACNKGVVCIHVKATRPLDWPHGPHPTHVCIRNIPHRTCALPVGKWDPRRALSQTSAFVPKSAKPAQIVRRFFHVQCPPALCAEFHVEDHCPFQLYGILTEIPPPQSLKLSLSKMLKSTAPITLVTSLFGLRNTYIYYFYYEVMSSPSRKTIKSK